MKKAIIFLFVAMIGLSYIPLNASAQDDVARRERRETKKWNRENRYREDRRYARYHYKWDNYYYGYNYHYSMPALPVMQTSVPTDVVSAIRNRFGAELYDIKTIQCMNGGDCYAVRVIRNGVAQTVIVDSSGSPTM